MPGPGAAGDRYRLTVSVNGREVFKTEVAGRSEGKGPSPCPAPRHQARRRSTRSPSTSRARGTFGYSATLTGFTRDFDPSPRAGPPQHSLSAVVDYLAAVARVPRADAAPSGFDSVVDATTFDNPASQVARGGRVRVAIGAWGVATEGQAGRGGARAPT